MTSVPYFSVITPSFNQGDFLEGCIRSVEEQGDPGVEHLVFDNCSTDTTAEVLARHPGVLAVSERDRGQSDAVNKGFRAARGEIICWLNSDDTYPAGTFLKLREAFRDPAVEVVFGDVLQVAYDGSEPRRFPAKFDRREDLVRWWWSRARLHQPAIFFRRSVRESIGFLREDLHFAMDYEYWWRMSEHHRFHYVPETLAIQHRQPQSKTVLDWSGVMREREVIFSPHYALVDDGDRPALLREKREVMSGRYLGEAFLNARSHRSAAFRSLLRSFREWPLSALHPRWLGVLARMTGLSSTRDG